MESNYSNLFLVYDIETLKSAFTVCFKSYNTGAEVSFVIHKDLNQINDLIAFLVKIKQLNYYMVGFNNLKFDSQIIELIWKKRNIFMKSTAKKIIEEIYFTAQEVINSDISLPEWKLTFPQIDLFKQKHYDGAAKLGTSLKWLQFTMRTKNVQDMPIEHNEKNISLEQISEILQYNWNDVYSTYEFFKLNKYETDLRLVLSKEYNVNVLNSSEPSIVKKIFGKLLAEDMKINEKDLKQLKTKRSFIKANSILLPYISFESVKLQEILKAIQKLIIYEDTDFAHEFEYNNTKITIGLGGIHGCVSPGIYKSYDGFIIEDVDVKSYYPNLGIKNNLKPEHLGESFTKRYDNIYQTRTTIPKSNPLNYVYKIILNTTYGLSKEENSFLYDPKYTYTITLNGQLLLLVLADKLKNRIPNIIFYQLNTDGITLGYEEKYKEEVQKIYQEWCDLTELELEYAYYSQMNIQDVNNYSAMTTSGKVKRKGSFCFEIPSELDWHKNPSFLIIPKAIDAYLFHSVPVETFIKNHDNIYDFLGAVKKTKKFELNLHYIKNGEYHVEKQQKVTRYYISTNGGSLVKDFYEDKTISCHSKLKVTPLNKIENEDIIYYKNINYNFYILKAKQIINSLEERNSNLLFNL